MSDAKGKQLLKQQKIDDSSYAKTLNETELDDVYDEFSAIDQEKWEYYHGIRYKCNDFFRLNYIYEPGRLPPRRQMFYQLVDVQIQQIAEEGFHAHGLTLVQFWENRTIFDHEAKHLQSVGPRVWNCTNVQRTLLRESSNYWKLWKEIGR